MSYDFTEKTEKKTSGIVFAPTPVTGTQQAAGNQREVTTNVKMHSDNQVIRAFPPRFGSGLAGSAATDLQTDRPRPSSAYTMDPTLPRPNLTEREKEVLRLVCDGLTNAEIAASLHVSRETVKSELKRIFRKIGVANRTQAAVLLVKQGWL